MARRAAADLMPTCDEMRTSVMPRLPRIRQEARRAAPLLSSAVLQEPGISTPVGVTIAAAVETTVVAGAGDRGDDWSRLPRGRHVVEIGAGVATARHLSHARAKIRSGMSAEGEHHAFVGVLVRPLSSRFPPFTQLALPARSRRPPNIATGRKPPVASAMRPRWLTFTASPAPRCLTGGKDKPFFHSLVASRRS